MSSYKQKFNPLSGQFNLVVPETTLQDIALNIMLNAFRIAQIGSLTIFSMVKGFMDEYEDESGVDTVNSINQTYEPTNDYYTPLIVGTIDSYTKLLLHLDNNFVDVATAKTVYNTGVTFSNSTYKFGYSGVFNGSSHFNLDADADFNFGTGDCTVDFWMNTTNTSSQYLTDWLTTDLYVGLRLILNSDDSITFFTESIAGFTTSTGLGLRDGNWHHIALVRNGISIVLYVDGVSKGNTTSSLSFKANMQPSFGYRYYQGDTFFNGYLDEIRVSKGIARWTSNFTPLSIPYGIPTTLNMTLLSIVRIADFIPTDARIVLFEEDVDSIALNTDLKVFVSRNNGTTWSQVTLEDEGNYIATARILSGIISIASQPSGSNIKYKIETLNGKKLNIHGTAVSWK